MRVRFQQVRLVPKADVRPKLSHLVGARCVPHGRAGYCISIEVALN
jgi:hypothetical protein